MLGLWLLTRSLGLDFNNRHYHQASFFLPFISFLSRISYTLFKLRNCGWKMEKLASWIDSSRFEDGVIEALSSCRP